MENTITLTMSIGLKFSENCSDVVGITWPGFLVSSSFSELTIRNHRLVIVKTKEPERQIRIEQFNEPTTSLVMKKTFGKIKPTLHGDSSSCAVHSIYSKVFFRRIYNCWHTCWMLGIPWNSKRSLLFPQIGCGKIQPNFALQFYASQTNLVTAKTISKSCEISKCHQIKMRQ